MEPGSSSAPDQYRSPDKDAVNTDHRIYPPLPVKIANRTLSSSCAHRFRQIGMINQVLHKIAAQKKPHRRSVWKRARLQYGSAYWLR